MAKTIPRKDVDFNVTQEVITTTAVTNATTWKLDAEWMTSVLLPAKKEWIQRWDDFENPSTRTPVITFAKNEARAKYEPLLRILVNNLKSNMRVSDDDCKAMGIMIRTKTNKPAPVPASYPGFRIDTRIIRCLILYFFDIISKARAKPHGVHGAEIRWAILNAPPAHIDELINSAFGTRSPFTLDFDESQRGKTVYFCLRWENTTGDKGPWSEIISAVIP
jgi:hypothetical protein